MKRLTALLVLPVLFAVLTGCGSRVSRGVDSLIMAIGEVDASCGPVVEYVRDQYEMLAEEDKQSLKNYDTLLLAEAAYVDALINEIGEVTPDSAGAIAAAEEAWNVLNQEAQALVTGLETLQTAKEECILKTLKRSLSGVWVNEVLGNTTAQIGRGLVRSYGLDETNCQPSQPGSCQFELREDGILIYGDEVAGSWILSADQTSVILDRKGETCILNIQKEGGYTKLVGALFDNAPFGYVRETEYVSAFHEKYVAAELQRENIHDYIADPVFIGKVNTVQKKSHNAYWYASQVYEDGLVYLGASCIIPVEYDHGGKMYHFWLEFPMLSTTNLKIKEIKINSDSHISGEIYYVKAEYVSGNYINEEGFRVLELTNGVSVVFDGYDETMNTFWNRCEAEYEDHIY